MPDLPSGAPRQLDWLKRPLPLTIALLVAAAVGLGANACLVGRAYLYGLMAGGQAGVSRALDILTAELERTMQLLGATSVAELTPETVRLR